MSTSFLSRRYALDRQDGCFAIPEGPVLVRGGSAADVSVTSGVVPVRGGSAAGLV